MTTTESLSSTAAVDTPRAGRYGKQLATHLGRRLVTEWDEHTATGLVVFDGGRCELRATPEQLLLHVELKPGTDPSVAAARRDLIEDVVGRHLVRLARARRARRPLAPPRRQRRPRVRLHRRPA